MATTPLTCPAQRNRAAKLLRQLRTIGRYHVHAANPYARYYATYHNTYGGVGQPAKGSPAQHHVMVYCLHLCYLAGFM
jgi:hypothetical protein